MRKLVVAMFMFVCGGSAFAMAQDPVKPQPATEKTESTEETTTSEPAKEEPVQTFERGGLEILRKAA